MEEIYKLRRKDNVFIFTDGSNHDDYITIQMAIKVLPNLKGIIISGGAYGNPGASLTIYTNFLRKFDRTDVKVYVGPLTSLFDIENGYSDTFAKQVTRKSLFFIDQLYGASYLIPNCGPNVINYDYEQDILNTESPVFLCLGNLTPVVGVAHHAKFIYIMGGRFNPPDLSTINPPSNLKINPFASSNIYADPIAAQRVLEMVGHKTAWLFSDSARSIPISEEGLERLEEITNCENRCSLEIIKVIYRTMIDEDIAYPVSDASLLILALYPELFTNITRERIIINTGVELNVNIDRNDAIVTQELVFSLGIGGMQRTEEGYLTYLVQGPREEEIRDVYFEILSLDDYILAHEENDESDCDHHHENHCDHHSEDHCRDHCDYESEDDYY